MVIAALGTTEWEARSTALREARINNVAAPRLAAAPSGPFDRMGDVRDDARDMPSEVIVKPRPEESVLAVPAAFDWRAVSVAEDAPPVHYTTRVRNQFLPQWCDSSWSHAASAVLGSRWLIHTSGVNANIDFSVQYFVNCVNVSSHGCSGGSAYQAFAHAHKYGAVDSSCQPYAAVTQQCSPYEICQQNLDAHHPQVKAVEPIRYYVGEYGRVGTARMMAHEKEVAMLREIYARGPVSACMACPRDTGCTLGYKGGIFATNNTRNECDHIVAIVGFGGVGNSSYWVVQNSLGSVWGEQGYFRVKRSSALAPGEHNLGIEKRVSWAMPKM